MHHAAEHLTDRRQAPLALPAVALQRHGDRRADLAGDQLDELLVLGAISARVFTGRVRTAVDELHAPDRASLDDERHCGDRGDRTLGDGRHAPCHGSGAGRIAVGVVDDRPSARQYVFADSPAPCPRPGEERGLAAGARKDPLVAVHAVEDRDRAAVRRDGFGESHSHGLDHVLQPLDAGDTLVNLVQGVEAVDPLLELAADRAQLQCPVHGVEIELLILDDDRGGVRDRAEQALVVDAEIPRALVQDLDDADGVSVPVAHRLAEDAAGREAGLLVEAAVEARVLVGVLDVDRLAGLRDPSGDTLTEAQAHLGRAPVGDDAAPDVLPVVVE